MKKIFTKEVKIGLSVIISLAILFFGINFLKGVNIFKAANYYYASYTDVTGLTTSAPVTINGFKVGIVRSMNYDYEHPGNVLVEISLDKQLKVPQGSKAVLVTDFLGTASIALDMAKSNEICAVGSRLEGEQKPGLMDALGQSVMPSMSQIMPKIDTLLTNINTLVGDPALVASVKRIDGITAQLENTSRNLTALTARLAPVVGDVKSITASADSLMANLNDVSMTVKRANIDSLIADLEATTSNLKQLSAQLNDPNSSLGKVMHDPALYDNINSTVASLDSLFVDIKKNPKRYIHIKVF